ncbi:hypothetical protein N865_03070 [Intrasporangium oryzae NRRL B-24470]|uniref:D-inositol 3-phosphate glycosyltransferase n=1 Tax=Intrasporangium oryzae NRRL B-24470 TaxID=1386089 RepID=W9GDF0_9MICO|nr:glycosyltransferase family 4 protein [Intrasporangium oryzae]EWT02858.1 hypothetical protein N865_03070 [Intrasporangium oryzae NRRL B-24470]
MAAARRIALVSSSYRPHPGGVEEHVRHVARELQRAGHEVVVWTVDRGEHLGTRSVDGIEVRYLPTPLPARTPRALVSYAARSPRAWAAWFRAYREFRPDVLHVQCFGPNGLYALALHHLTRTPLVVSSHGETFGDDHDVFAESDLLRAGLRHALTRAAAVTGCSSYVLDDLRDRFGLADGLVVPNGIELDEVVRPVRPDWWPRGAAVGTPVGTGSTARDGAPHVVLGVGRVEHNKGFDLLLRAAADLPATTHVVVGGEGSQRQALQTLAADLGLSERVHFPGRLSRAEVAGAMAQADVLAVPSRREAFGIVALEAWRGGTPLVMTSRGGARDFVHDGVDGLLVDPTDVPALTRAIREVLSDPGRGQGLSEAGRRSVTAYTWDRVARDYEGIYDTVLGASVDRA